MGSCQPAPLQPRPSGWLHLSSRHSASSSVGLIITIRAWSGDCHVGQYTHTHRNELWQARDKKLYIPFAERKSACLNINYFLTIIFFTALKCLLWAFQYICIKFQQSKHPNTPNLMAYWVAPFYWVILNIWQVADANQSSKRQKKSNYCEEKKHSSRIWAIMESWPHRYQELRYERDNVTFQKRPAYAAWF